MRGVELNLSFGVNVIYKNANFSLNKSDKVGIVGVNGAGKSTLFHVILGDIKLDSGKIILEKKDSIGYLPQEIIVPNDITVLDYLLSARPISKLEEKLKKLYDDVSVASINEQDKILKKIANVQEMLDYYDVYNAENILFEIIENMHIDYNLLDLKMNDLSGGQKSKIAFAHLLYSKSSIFLLDEPTNHLDVETREYVTNYLKKYKGTILVISHDIDFLNSITNKIMYIDKANKNIQIFNGDYNTFLKKYEFQKENKERLIAQELKEQQKLRDIVLLYSNSSGKRKRMAQSREKLLNKKMQNNVERDKEYKKVKMKIKPARDGSKIPLTLDNVDFGYDKLLIKNLSFVINNHERFLIVGENGVGKTTLLKLIVGILKIQNGSINYGSKTDIAYYAQEQELLDLNKTVLENIDSKEYSINELRSLLGNFLFYGDDAFKLVNVLSPGEKARLSLLKIMLKKANLLLLDEPTNHLDPETQKIIGQNFADYEGTIILVSHNKHFVNQIGIDRMLILPSGKITNYSDELLDYYYNINNKNC